MSHKLAIFLGLNYAVRADCSVVMLKVKDMLMCLSLQAKKCPGVYMFVQ